MKNIFNIVLIFLFSVSFNNTLAQDSTTINFFPYQTGDFWVNEVYEMNRYQKDERIDVISDSVTSNGDTVFTLSSTLDRPNERIYHIKIDSSGNIYSDWWYDKGDWLKVLHSSKSIGETWILEKDSVDPSFIQYELAEVMDEYKIKFFGDSTLVREVRYARTTNDSTSTKEGYGRLYVWWSQVFGVLESTALELPIYQPRLKGLMLGEIAYGDTTANLEPVSIEDGIEDEFPENFQLSNYPNPFNSTTNFVIDIKKPGSFTLEVYDSVGRKAAEIFNHKRLSSGRHTIAWEAKQLTTGMYFVRLRGNDRVQIQTITLLK